MDDKKLDKYEFALELILGFAIFLVLVGVLL